MEKLNMKTKDLTQGNITKLTKLFPEIITEVEKNGNIIKTINVDKLKYLVGDFTEDSAEVYELSWVGKHKSRQKIVMPINKTLRPVPEDSVDFENTENLYIEGDNFEVLKLLQESYLNKFKMIYIDPPYNTGTDFVYKDNFSKSREEYDEESGAIDEEGNKLFKNTTANGRFHSDWLSMMFERLVIARDLLRDDGVLFISIDDNEVANLRKICDEVFGEGNFVGKLIWRKKAGGGQADDFFVKEHEYIVVYQKSSDFIWNDEEIPDDISKYNKEDEDGKFNLVKLAKWGNTARRADRPTMYYPLIDPEGKKNFPVAPDGNEGRWRVGKQKMEDLIQKNLVHWEKRNNKYVPYEKIYYEKNKIKINKFRSILYDIAQTGDGSNVLTNLFGKKDLFENPKPVELLSSFMKENLETEEIILDFFSGSATTAHAVMQLNAEDGGNRKFIMVQLPEPTPKDSEAFKAGYENISEIGKERIRRAAEKIKEENKDKNLSNVDFGFRVFKVDSSNMKDVYYNPKDIDQRTLTNLKDNIKEDRTDKDLLYQVLLDLAIPISAKVREEKANNKTIYRVEINFLIACFDDDVDLETIKKIAELNPLRIVFKDSSFKDDATKVNCDEYLKNKLPNTIVKVI